MLRKSTHPTPAPTPTRTRTRTHTYIHTYTHTHGYSGIKTWQYLGMHTHHIFINAGEWGFDTQTNANAQSRCDPITPTTHSSESEL